jgi:hypothetical protein
MVLPERPPRETFVPGKARCAVCGTEISDRRWRLFQTCEFWKCRVEHRSKQRALRKEVEERQRREREEFERRIGLLRAEAARRLGIDDPQSYVPAAIPAAECGLGDVAPQRPAALGRHLEQRIAEALEKRNGSPPEGRDDADPSPPGEGPGPILQRACATCRGACCRRGGEEAYLSAKTVLGYLERRSDADATGVLQAYLSRVPERSCEDSCIYHGENGCVLPREMRSSICNGFECTGLQRLREKLSGPGPHRVFLVALKDSRVVRFEFVHV